MHQSYSKYYAGCSMNCKSNFNIIKVPGNVPGKGLEIRAITVSLKLVQAILIRCTQTSRWSELLSENSSAWLSLQEPTMYRLEVSPTQLKWCICIPWQDFSFPLWSSPLAGHRDCNTKPPSREEDEIRNFSVTGWSILWMWEILRHTPQSHERSLAKIKHLNLKNFRCLDCLYLILLKIDQYGTDCLESWRRRYTLSEPKWDTNWSLCCSSVQITLILAETMQFCLYVEGLLSFQDTKKRSRVKQVD